MLLELQRTFRATVTSRDDAVAPLVRAAHGPVSRRIAVYRNTVQKSLIDVLAVAFPVTQRIVGERFFAAMARDFVVQHPPRAPQLSLYGDGFAAFIAAHQRTQGLPYLADVARLEWARGEAYFAADAPALDPAALAAIAPDQLVKVKLNPHPATRLMTSTHPIHRIWAVNQPDVADVPAIDMNVAESVLISRPLYEVHLRKITQANGAFVAACAQGQMLGEAVAQAFVAEPAFDFQAALQDHLINGTFTALTLS